MRLAKSQRISTSGRASPGASTAFSSKVMRRSELVIVPVFSAQPAAGKITSAYLQASLLIEMSCTTTKRAFFKASSTNRALGKLTNGLVQTIQMAFMRPSFSASNICVAVNPGLADKS